MKEITRVKFDDTLDALAHVQRRRLLVGLLEGDSPVEIEDSKDGPNSAEQLVRMGHVHLPKLEEHGFISWDRERNEVSKGHNFDQIGPLVELLDDHADELPDGWV